MSDSSDKKSVKIAYIGLFAALALVFSYVESFLPLNIGIPGAKIGLPNIVIVAAIYLVGPADALALSLIRIVVVGFTFGNMSMMIYSLAGALLSFGVMLLARKSGYFSVLGVSVLGGVFHNIAQIIVAVFVLETGSLIYYLPFLIVVGTVSGVLIGIISSIVTKRIGSISNFKSNSQ